MLGLPPLTRRGPWGLAARGHAPSMTLPSRELSSPIVSSARASIRSAPRPPATRWAAACLIALHATRRMYSPRLHPRRSTCSPRTSSRVRKRPITVIAFRGTVDPLVPYAGGASRPPIGLNVTVHSLGAEKTLQRWEQLNGCTGTPVVMGGGCKTYTQCKGGSEERSARSRPGAMNPVTRSSGGTC